MYLFNERIKQFVLLLSMCSGILLRLFFFTGGVEQRLIKCVNDKYQLREEET